MTSRYRVEYALKSHKRDNFIEWIKGLLAVPFVLRADPENYDNDFDKYYKDPASYEKYALSKEEEIGVECQKGYLLVLQDVERLIEHKRMIDKLNDSRPGEDYIESRLHNLVPSVGRFHTPLPLSEAFLVEDERRTISQRRLVLPSFNDVRSILNTAQIIALLKIHRHPENNNGHQLKLVTFDGDVTLYDDGKSLEKLSPVVTRLLMLLLMDLFIGVVTAAGYAGQAGAIKYYERLRGLVDALRESTTVTDSQKANLLIMGGESNYLFRYDVQMGNFKFIDSADWFLPMMLNWDKGKILYIMDTMEDHLKYLRRKLKLEQKSIIIKKERSLGIIADPNQDDKIVREHLEEMVLSCSIKVRSLLNKTSGKFIKSSSSQTNIPNEDGSNVISKEANTIEEDSNIRVCAFNGGADVWVDIGDKSLGVESLQRYLCRDEQHPYCPILKSESLHIGDQFASVGANDFKARLSACTVWIASPQETVAILDDLIARMT